MPNQDSDLFMIIIAIIIGAIIALLLLIEAVVFLQRFSKDLNRINREIQRAAPEERNYWLRKKRRLWLSLIPFVRYKNY